MPIDGKFSLHNYKKCDEMIMGMGIGSTELSSVRVCRVCTVWKTVEISRHQIKIENENSTWSIILRNI